MSDAFDIVPGAALVHSAGDVLATIFDSLDTLVAYMDRDFNIIRVNRAFATASGHAPEDLVGRNCFALFPNPPAEAAFRRAVQSGDPYAAYAMPCFFGDEPGRETSCWDWHLRPVKDESGRVAAVVLALNDVTEWHRTELALEESEEQFRAISTAAQDAVLMADDEGRIAYWNPAAERLFGFRAEEVLGQPLSRVLVPERHVAAHERGYAAFRVAGTGKMIGRTMELEARRRDGSELPVEISVSAVKRKGHWHAVAILRDIAERRRLEADLRKNEALFRHLAEASPVGIFRTDANGDCTYVNERWSEIAGLESAQAMGQGWVRALHPEDGAAVERSWYHAARTGRPFKAEYRFRRPDGKVTWVLGQAVRETGADGEDGYVGTITDITDRKRAEQALKRSEANLNEAQRLAQLGDWELDLVNNVLGWSDEIYRIFEVDPAEFGASYEAFLATVHPEDRELVNRTYTESVKNRTPYDIVHRLLMKDGRVKYVQERCETFYDDSGRPLRSIGTVQDITDRKLAERQVEKVNRALRTLSAGNTVLIHATGEAALLSDVCHIIVETGGYRLAWVGVAEHDAAKTVRAVAQAGLDEGFLEGACVTWADAERGRGPVGTAIRSGRPVVFQDVQNDPRFAARRAEALQRGYAAMIGLPLKNTNGGTPLGALAICASEPRAFDDDEIRLLQELADDLAFGIQTLRTRDERERLQAEQRDGSRRLQRALLQTIQAVSLTVEKRDPYTAGHQQRVADVAVAIAGELGLPPERIEGIRLGAMIHDIGKIYAPAEILNRPGQLSAVEFEMIKTHSRVGYDIMKGVEFPWPVAEMILQHHERYDGSGYPRGLRGEEIMLEARILAVADVIESMYSHRPYRPALGLNAALDEITQNRGNFYDPAVVDACLKLHREGRLPLSLLTRR